MARMLAYIRISTVKQGDGVSLEQQRDAIERYAVANGHTIVTWYEEKKTAAKRGRPAFSAMLKRLRKGTVDGVIIHKIDRSARNLRDWADISDLIDIGVKVEFAHDSIDLTTRGGRLSADLQAAIAADYIRNLRDETIKGLYGRLKQGIYPFAAPLGYLNTGAGKPKAVNPETAPLISDAFKLYATGEYSLDVLRKHLANKGLVRPNGKPICKNTISRTLRNPFYTGLMQIKKTGEVFEGKHTPIVSQQNFAAVQKILDKKIVKKLSKHNHLFSNLLHCKTCGCALPGERQKQFVYYRCHNKNCPITSVREDRIDSTIQHLWTHLSIDQSLVNTVVNLAKRHHKKHDEIRQRELSQAQLQLTKLEERLSKLTDFLLDGTISKIEYASKKAALLQKKSEYMELKSSPDNDSRMLISNIQRTLEQCKKLDMRYKNADQQGKRDILRFLSSNFFVHGKKLMVELKTPYREMLNLEGVYESSLDGDEPRTNCSLCRFETTNRRSMKFIIHAFTLGGNSSSKYLERRP